MLLNWRWASWVLPTVPFFLGACQLISGLSGVTSEDGASASGGAGGASSGGAGLGGNGGGGLSSGNDGGGGSIGGGGQGGGLPPCQAEACVEVLTTNTVVPVSTLTITKKHLVWGENGSDMMDGSIYMALLPKGAPEFVLTGLSITQIAGDPASDDELVLWIDNGSPPPDRGVWQTPLGAPMKMQKREESGQTLALAVNDGYAYWVALKDHVMRKVALTGGAEDIFTLPVPVGAPATLAFGEGTNIYWIGDLGTGNGIKRLSFSDKMLINHVKDTSPDAYGLAFFNANLYWTEKDSGAGGGVWMGPASGGTTVKQRIDDMTAMNPGHLIVGGDYVYWSDGPSGCASSTVTVRRRLLTLNSSTVQTLISGVPCTSNFVQDALYIYVGAGKTLYRIQK